MSASTAPALLLARFDRAVQRLSSQRFALIGLSITRLLVGSLILLDLLIHAAQRQTLWGPLGWYTHEHMLRDQRVYVSLFNLGSPEGPATTNLLYLGYAVVALLFTIGWRTAFTTPLLLLFVWTFQERNPYLINGGDNLIRIVLFYLMFATMNEYLSVGARKRRAARRDARQTAWRAIRIVAHNAAFAACILQLCVLYLGSAMFKIQGEMWQNGTAAYYITRVAEYNSWPELTSWLMTSPIIITVVTYGTVFIQLAFPFTLFRRWTRHTIFVLLAGMHVGIAVLMGLPIFSGFMLAVDLLLFTDAEWRRGAARALAVWRRVRIRAAATGRAVPVRRAGRVTSLGSGGHVAAAGGR